MFKPRRDAAFTQVSSAFIFLYYSKCIVSKSHWIIVHFSRWSDFTRFSLSCDSKGMIFSTLYCKKKKKNHQHNKQDQKNPVFFSFVQKSKDNVIFDWLWYLRQVESLVMHLKLILYIILIYLQNSLKLLLDNLTNRFSLLKILVDECNNSCNRAIYWLFHRNAENRSWTFVAHN